MKALLKNKIAIITGGTRGIGKAIAKCFIEQGASCALLGVNEKRGEETANELQKFIQDSSQKVAFFSVDVADYKAVNANFGKIQEEFGPIDILVNNAGVTRDNLLMRISEEDWEAVINTNLKSVYNTCRSIVRPMMKSRKGKIINITSVVGLMGNAGQTNYAASKSGMIGFTKSLAKEMGSRNICINCIAPGFIRSEMTDRLEEKTASNYLNQIPMGRFGEPEDVADVALFLASSMADYITGQVITVDGGMVMA
ncbi:MAG: 3-oxoacyl-ACP reductase FabG [Chlamydiia bacterium]|nr:3-oxoacyl-ACP reductase FabG [Chlamydiia bacterium]